MLLGLLAAPALAYAAALGVARLIGFGREAVIAHLFGVSGATDAYVAAIALPELLAGLFVGGLVSYAVIPALARLMRQGADRRAGQLIGAAITQVVLWCSLFAALAFLFASPLISLAAPGLTSSAHETAATMLRITSPAVLFFGLAGLAGALLNARHRFLPVAFALIAANATAIAVLVALPRKIEAAAVAYLASAVVAAAIQWIAVLRREASFPVDLTLRNPEIRAVLRAGCLAILVTGAPYLRYFFERVLASTLAEGDLAALGFATRLVLLVGALIAIPVSTVAFTRMAEHAASLDIPALRATIRRALVVILGLSAPATLALVLLGTPLVKVLFEHGAFNASASSVTASVLRIYALALVGACLAEVAVRALFVLGRERLALAVTAVSLAGTIVLATLLVRRFALEGLALAVGIGVSLNALALVIAVNRALDRHLPALERGGDETALPV